MRYFSKDKPYIVNYAGNDALSLQVKTTMATNIENVIVRREKLAELGEHAGIKLRSKGQSVIHYMCFFAEKISANAARLANQMELAAKEK